MCLRPYARKIPYAAFPLRLHTWSAKVRITTIPDFGFNFFNAESCFLWCHRNCIAKAQCPLWMPFAVVIDAALTIIIIPRRALCINRKPQAGGINKDHLLPQFTLLLCCALN